MATIVYGTHYFNKNMGSFGEKVTCGNCNSTYKKAFVKQSRWFHIDYIPLIPLPPVYAKICPVCGDGDLVKNKEAKAEMAAYAGNNASELQAFAKHSKADKRYEFWYKDLATGEEFCVDSTLSKSDLKNALKERGLKLKKITVTEI